MRDVYYGYDLRGLQTYARFDNAVGESVTNVYDGLGRITSSTTAMAGTSRTVTAEYDAGNNRTRLTTPRGSWTYTYDAAGRMIGLYEGVGTGTVMSSWDYNAQGLPKKVTERFGSGASWDYDGSGRLTNQNDTFAGGTGNVAVTLGYNPANQIDSRLSTSNDYTFGGHYAVNRSYGVNGLNQYTGAGPATFAYDANGNLIADGRTAYVYDAENRLVRAGETSLVYDPLGRLFQVSGSSGFTQFLYDGDQLVAEYDASGSLTDGYVHGPGADDPLLWYPAGNAARWYHRNHQGSIMATASGPGGTLAAINTYDEYGIPGADNRGRFQYTGQAFLPEIGMYHYKARIYSPTLGRFLQTDPIGYDDQINLYAYVANDPVNKTDPTGKYECVNNGNGTMTCTARGGPLWLAGVDRAAMYIYIAAVKAGLASPPPPPLHNEGATQSGQDSGQVSDRPAGPDGKRGATGGPGAGKRFKPETPEERAAKEGVPCRYCGQPTTNTPGRGNSRERDHIDPKSRGGNNSPENEGDACRDCNRSKGPRNPDEWPRQDRISDAHYIINRYKIRFVSLG